MNDTIVLILAGGAGTRLGELTRGQCKPALSFGGRYRNIDFSLSNCINSGQRRVGVLSQYRSQSLLRHLQAAWGALPRRLGEFVELWPAQQRAATDWYRGTIDAVAHNLDLIRELGARRVLVLAGDHVYRMDYRPLLAYHVNHGGPVTVSTTAVPASQARAFGVLEVDPLGRISRFTEKPRDLAWQVQPGRAVLVSMGLYVIDVDWLEHTLPTHPGWVDFGHHLLPAATAGGLAYAFPFRDMHCGGPGYWRDVGTLSSYWRAHLDLLGPKPVFPLHDSKWPLWSAPTDLPPAEFSTGPAGEPCHVQDSLVADGARVLGARVSRCVLGNGAHVAPGASLERVIVLPGGTVKPGATVRDAVIDSVGCIHPATGRTADGPPAPARQTLGDHDFEATAAAASIATMSAQPTIHFG